MYSPGARARYTPAMVIETDAVEVHELGSDGTPIVLTCEHASERLPPPWAWADADRRLLGTHWTHDVGAAAITRALSARLRCGAVLSRFTRLLVDPNRDLDAETLFRRDAEAAPVELNGSVDERERALRIERYYRPYHNAVGHAVRERPGAALLSVHSFTPVYEGTKRPMEIGILFVEGHGVVARRLADVLSHAGWRVALNEPYSGEDGFAFSPERHGTAHGRPWVELEIRQDVATDLEGSARLVDVLGSVAPMLFCGVGM